MAKNHLGNSSRSRHHDLIASGDPGHGENVSLFLPSLPDLDSVMSYDPIDEGLFQFRVWYWVWTLTRFFTALSSIVRHRQHIPPQLPVLPGLSSLPDLEESPSGNAANLYLVHRPKHRADEIDAVWGVGRRRDMTGTRDMTDQ
ncbi:MAG: hypothetical protein TREMPRED_005715 [Tremellales sp. Tagirdzhanova-0007]|nr:MAG: hypothetical protein TREMPRED_005715 [Tremellales sp. Tagirdzhanova-0007]